MHRPVNWDSTKDSYTFHVSGHETKVNCEMMREDSAGSPKAASTTDTGGVCTQLCLSIPPFNENNAIIYQFGNDKSVRFGDTDLRSPCVLKITFKDLLKATVVPGVLEDRRLKRVLHLNATACTVTTICTWKKKTTTKK